MNRWYLVAALVACLAVFAGIQFWQFTLQHIKADNLALASAHADIGRMRFLLRSGANPNMEGGFVRQDGDGPGQDKTVGGLPLLLLLKRPYPPAMHDRVVGAVKLLLMCGANPNAVDEDNRGPLELTNDKDIQALLRQYGAKL